MATDTTAHDARRQLAERLSASARMVTDLLFGEADQGRLRRALEHARRLEALLVQHRAVLGAAVLERVTVDGVTYTSALDALAEIPQVIASAAPPAIGGLLRAVDWSDLAARAEGAARTVAAIARGQSSPPARTGSGRTPGKRIDVKSLRRDQWFTWKEASAEAKKQNVRGFSDRNLREHAEGFVGLVVVWNGERRSGVMREAFLEILERSRAARAASGTH